MLKLTTDKYKASRGLSATTELLAIYSADEGGRAAAHNACMRLADALVFCFSHQRSNRSAFFSSCFQHDFSHFDGVSKDVKCQAQYASYGTFAKNVSVVGIAQMVSPAEPNILRFCPFSTVVNFKALQF